MKTAENQNKSESKDSKVQANVTTVRPSIANPSKGIKDETARSGNEVENDLEKTEITEPAKTTVQSKESIQFNPQEAPPKAEQKNEAVKREISSEKPALDLESTLKLVEELHRRKIQRDRLLETIDTLEAFEVAQKEDAEETDSNHFQSCILTIEDDNHRKFSTKNPVIIFSVAQYVNSMCVNRLAEIEAGITIPA